MDVDDIRLVFQNPVTQFPDVKQRAQALAAYRPGKKLCAGGIDTVFQWPVSRQNGHPVAGCAQVLGNFDGDKLRSADAEGHQCLYYMHNWNSAAGGPTRLVCWATSQSVCNAYRNTDSWPHRYPQWAKKHADVHSRVSGLARGRKAAAQPGL